MISEGEIDDETVCVRILCPRERLVHSFVLRTESVMTWIPSVRPAASVPVTACLTVAGLERSATRDVSGRIVVRNSTRFPAISATVAERGR